MRRTPARTLLPASLLLATAGCLHDHHERDIGDSEVTAPGLSHAVSPTGTYPLDLGTFELRHRARSTSSAEDIRYFLTTSDPDLEWETPSGTLRPSETHKIRLFLNAFRTGTFEIRLRLTQDRRFHRDGEETWIYFVHLRAAGTSHIADGPTLEAVGGPNVVVPPRGADLPVAHARLSLPVGAAATAFRVGRGSLGLHASPEAGTLDGGAAVELPVFAAGQAGEALWLGVEVGDTVHRLAWRNVAPRAAALVELLGTITDLPPDTVWEHLELTPGNDPAAPELLGQGVFDRGDGARGYLFLLEDGALEGAVEVPWSGASDSPTLRVTRGDGGWQLDPPVGDLHVRGDTVLVLVGSGAVPVSRN